MIILLIHFLGGAIVGAAPDISYRYILERLAQKGFLIVATPYTLSFDYIATCDENAKSNAGIIPLLDQSLDVLEQIPSLIEEVADGARDFNPTPASVKAAAKKTYRARRTLVIEYDDDPLDESEQVEALLREAETVMRNKRPMVDFDVQRTVLKGGHDCFEGRSCYSVPCASIGFGI